MTHSRATLIQADSGHFEACRQTNNNNKPFAIALWIPEYFLPEALRG